MKKVSFVFTVLLVGLVMNSFAQPGFYNKIKIQSGDLKFLKGATELKLDYNYDNMMVGDMKEEDYMTRRQGEMNKAKSGSGDEWKVKWVNDRMNRFEPNFEKKFVPKMAKIGITASKGKTDAKYTLIIKTTLTEPGLYTGISYAEKKTFVNIYAIFVETANPSNELCRIYCEKMTGDMDNFDVGARISASYLVTGNLLGGLIQKTLKKMK